MKTAKLVDTIFAVATLFSPQVHADEEIVSNEQVFFDTTTKLAKLSETTPLSCSYHDFSGKNVATTYQITLHDLPEEHGLFSFAILFKAANKDAITGSMIVSYQPSLRTRLDRHAVNANNSTFDYFFHGYLTDHLSMQLSRDDSGQESVKITHKKLFRGNLAFTIECAAVLLK